MTSAPFEIGPSQSSLPSSRPGALQYASILPGAFEAWADRLERGEAPSKYALYLIDQEAETVDFLGASRLSNDAVYLAALYLLPSLHRQGIGKGALQRLLAMDAYRGAPTLFVQAHERADWAISFYERLGLRIIARGQDAIAGIEEGVLAPFALPEAVLLTGRIAETDLR